MTNYDTIWSDIDRMFGATFEDLILSPARKTIYKGLSFPASIRCSEETLQVECELPGFDKESISVSVENNNLIVKGKKTALPVVDDMVVWRNEISYGNYSRSWSIANIWNPDSVQAEYADGVLKITLQRKPETKAKTVEIKGLESKTQGQLKA